jgi:FAD-dependent oxidoreductase domain-containing protein 1
MTQPIQNTEYDVVIIGGGIVGSCTAYHLLEQNPSLKVAVLEPDSNYEYASALRSSGGCRVQFTRPENILMSLYSIDFIKNIKDRLNLKKHEANVDWVEGGYLFLVPPEATDILEKNVAVQRALGCTVELLNPEQLKQKYPSMYVDDLGAGALTPHDGWCDPYGLLWAFRHKVVELGGTYIPERFESAVFTDEKVTAVHLSNGQNIHADHFVITAGAWSGQIAAKFDMYLPITPMKRYEHYFTPAQPMEHLPYVKDLARLAFRSEGPGFSGGLVDGEARRGFNFDVDHDYWQDIVWPAVAHRFPNLEVAKCQRTWSGLYEQNELDGNPVIGAWNNKLKNLYTAAGFSGHGMMHAPAAGRGIAELINYGEFKTIDLTNLGYERIENNQPYAEAGIL